MGAELYSTDARQYATDWLNTTIQQLKDEAKKLDVKVTGELVQKIRGDFQERADAVFAIGIAFPTKGRFVDMGVGRLPNNENLIEQLREPKKFYSPIFYRRLNSIMGAMSSKLIDETVASFKTLEA